MPRECLKIIESKSKVRQSRNKAVVAKMSTSSSTPAISSDVAELKDMVRALILDRKNQTPVSAPVKAVEQSCVTCGGGHFYQNCPATNSNIYHDNIQEYVSGTDNQEKDEKQSQNDKTGLGMEKTVKDKAKSKPESQSSQKVNWSKSKPKSTPRSKSKKYKFRD
ncbi:hypothetical protein Tco_1550539 [Tanacetum coccineum]